MTGHRPLAASAPRFLWLSIAAIGLTALIYLRWSATDPTQSSRERCRVAATRSEYYRCWTSLFEKTLAGEGVTEAFRLLAALYVSEPDVPSLCHLITHRIGEITYQKFAAGENVAITPETAFCNYGFYHGFMESLVTNGGDTVKARAFCASVGSDLNAETPDAVLQCFHGIGHGMVNGHDPDLWGNEQAMIERGLNICETVADTPDRLYRCTSGVFNGIAFFHIRGQYGLRMADVDPSDPLRLCRLQLKPYREPCYGNMQSLLAELTDGNFPQIAATIERIADDGDAASAIWYHAGYHMKRELDRPDHADEIRICRGLREPLRLPCIRGLATGFLWNGLPGREYEGALSFCGTGELSEHERRACFDAVASQLAGLYPQRRVEKICRTIPVSHRAGCGGGNEPQ